MQCVFLFVYSIQQANVPNIRPKESDHSWKGKRYCFSRSQQPAGCLQFFLLGTSLFPWRYPRHDVLPNVFGLTHGTYVYTYVFPVEKSVKCTPCAVAVLKPESIQRLWPEKTSNRQWTQATFKHSGTACCGAKIQCISRLLCTTNSCWNLSPWW